MYLSNLVCMVNFEWVYYIPVDCKTSLTCYYLVYIYVGCFRVTVNKIEDSLPELSRDLWKRRALMDFIILVEWSGSDDDLKIKSTLNNLKDAIYKVWCSRNVTSRLYTDVSIK